MWCWSWLLTKACRFRRETEGGQRARRVSTAVSPAGHSRRGPDSTPSALWKISHLSKFDFCSSGHDDTSGSTAKMTIKHNQQIQHNRMSRDTIFNKPRHASKTLLTFCRFPQGLATPCPRALRPGKSPLTSLRAVAPAVHSKQCPDQTLDIARSQDPQTQCASGQGRQACSSPRRQAAPNRPLPDHQVQPPCSCWSWLLAC